VLRPSLSLFQKGDDHNTRTKTHILWVLHLALFFQSMNTASQPYKVQPTFCCCNGRHSRGRPHLCWRGEACSKTRQVAQLLRFASLHAICCSELAQGPQAPQHAYVQHALHFCVRGQRNALSSRQLLSLHSGTAACVWHPTWQPPLRALLGSLRLPVDQTTKARG